MASLSQPVDVAVVDEIQMLGDASRCKAPLLPIIIIVVLDNRR